MSYEYSSGMWRWIEQQAPQTIIMPPYLVVGDCWEFTRVIGAYANFTGSMTFVGPGSGNKVTSVATTDQGVFEWDFPAADTAPLTPQPYLWTCQMVGSTDGCRYTIQSGSISVVSDITAAAPQQTQTMLQQQLAVLDQTLLSIYADKMSQVMYAGQSYTEHNVKDLWFIRNSLANRVADEQAVLSGNSRSKRIIPRFVFR